MTGNSRSKRPWDEKRARSLLASEFKARASNPKTSVSDAALERLSLLAEPSAARNESSFRKALKRAGWRPRRIAEAVHKVRRGAPAYPLVARALREAWADVRELGRGQHAVLIVAVGGLVCVGWQPALALALVVTILLACAEREEP